MFFRSLLVQLSLAVILIATVTLTIFGYINYQETRSSMLQELNLSLERTANRLTTGIRTPLYNIHSESIQDILLAEMESPTVSRILIIESGLTKPSYGYSRNKQGQIVTDLSVPQDHPGLQTKRIVRYADEDLGEIFVYMTQDHLDQTLRRILYQDIFQILLLNLILTGLVITTLHANFVRPVKQLTKTTQAIADGQLDHEILSAGHTEISILARGISSMRNAIKDKIMRLQLELDQRRRIEDLMRAQRDLALQLSRSSSLPEILTACLNMSLTLSGMSYGLACLHNPPRLVTSRELSAATCDQIITGPLMQTDQTQYYTRQQISEIFDNPELGCLAVYPIGMDGRILATIAIGSTAHAEFSTELRTTIEDTILQMGSAVSRGQAEAELLDARNYIDNIINSMPSILVGVDTQGRITHWNSRAASKTGLNPEEACGQLLTDAFPHLENLMHQIKRAIHEREPQISHKITHQRNEVTNYENLTIYPLVANGVQGAVVRIDDITEQVRLEEIMIQAEKMASVGGLAAGMAHEINNPLAGILQNVQVIQNRTQCSLPKNQKVAADCGVSMQSIHNYLEQRGIIDMLASIQETGTRAAHIVDSMLTFSRKSRAQAEPEDMAQLLDRTVELAANDYDLKKSYDFRHIRIIKEYEPDLPPVLCKGAQIQQVILNLLKNGAQAMGISGGDSASFILRLHRAGDKICIEVEDNGPGMPDQVKRHIFEPFFTTKDVGFGTGLGLSVSYFIITEHHHGQMEVESTPGEGTRFIIQLPLQTDSGA